MGVRTQGKKLYQEGRRDPLLHNEDNSLLRPDAYGCCPQLRGQACNATLNAGHGGQRATTIKWPSFDAEKYTVLYSGASNKQYLLSYCQWGEAIKPREK